MPKLVYFLNIYVMLCSLLVAEEQILATLVSVKSNGIQKLGISNYTFPCESYGVLTLEKLYDNSNIDSVCQNTIKDFYKKYPELEYYSASILHVKQMYHIEFKKQECVLYARGQKILSELLLEEGLAVLNPLFQDEEYAYTFNKAQANAKFYKKGLWQEDTLGACMDSLYGE